MTKIILNGQTAEIAENVTLRQLSESIVHDKMICGALVDNRVCGLSYIPSDNEHIVFFDEDDPVGARIYENTLSMVFVMAGSMSFKNKSISMRYSIAGGIYAAFDDGSVMSEDELELIRRNMSRIIDADASVNETYFRREDAQRMLAAINCVNKLELFECVNDEQIRLYDIDGFYGYFYTALLPSAGMLHSWQIVKYANGCVLLGLRADSGVTYRLIQQENIFQELESYENWCARLGVSDVTSLNRVIADGSINNLITIAEARHEQLIGKIAAEIYQARGTARVVLIAGPSSSGKTTTSKRLRTHLTAMGLRPVAIGLDDYFIDRDKTPLGADGKPNFECLEALNVELFNENLLELMAGKEALLPIYDFKTGRSSREGRRLSVDADSPIIIEGIHGLNDSLTSHIPSQNKYKIYINDLTHLNIDQYNRIPTSDVRLIRRIVRDRVARGHDAAATIDMWQSVRAGEEQNIFPFSHQADFVLNSSLFYELSVLKKYALPALLAITPEQPLYHEAERLLTFLSFFRTLDDEKAIPTGSLLREFIGGNIYDEL